MIPVCLQTKRLWKGRNGNRPVTAVGRRGREGGVRRMRVKMRMVHCRGLWMASRAVA